MVKQFVFFKRKSGMDVEDFQHYWRTTHAELTLKAGGGQRYIQCTTLLSAYQKGMEPIWDGVAETWYDSTRTVKEQAGSKSHAALRADEPNFIDVSTMGWIYCREQVIKDGTLPDESVKAMVFVRRRPEWDVDSFQKYWLEIHGPIGAALPGALRYVQNHTWRSYYNTGKTPMFDGLAEVWFKDTQKLRAAVNSSEYARNLEDADKFLVVCQAAFVITRERVIVP